MVLRGSGDSFPGSGLLSESGAYVLQILRDLSMGSEKEVPFRSLTLLEKELVFSTRCL